MNSPLHGPMDDIDLAAVEQVQELDPDGTLIVQLISYFVADASAGMGAIMEMAAAGSVKDAIRLLHTLKSSSGCVGATRVVQLAGALEQRTRVDGVMPARADVDVLAGAVQTACRQLLQMFPDAVASSDAS